jgi:hypothetical protein
MKAESKFEMTYMYKIVQCKVIIGEEPYTNSILTLVGLGDLSCK